jgi:hypothetical protein
VCPFGVTDADRRALLVNRVVDAYPEDADNQAMLRAAFRVLPK